MASACVRRVQEDWGDISQLSRRVSALCNALNGPRSLLAVFPTRTRRRQCGSQIPEGFKRNGRAASSARNGRACCKNPERRAEFSRGTLEAEMVGSAIGPLRLLQISRETAQRLGICAQDERTACAQAERDAAVARLHAVASAWTQVAEHLALADARAHDARAGFTRLVREGGGPLVLAEAAPQLSVRYEVLHQGENRERREKYAAGQSGAAQHAPHIITQQAPVPGPTSLGKRPRGEHGLLACVRVQEAERGGLRLWRLFHFHAVKRRAHPGTADAARDTPAARARSLPARAAALAAAPRRAPRALAVCAERGRRRDAARERAGTRRASDWRAGRRDSSKDNYYAQHAVPPPPVPAAQPQPQSAAQPLAAQPTLPAPLTTPAAPAPPAPAFPATNAQNQRICRQCGMAGRYKDGKCVEKWGPGPLGPGTVCDRCRKKMKRVERRGTAEGLVGSQGQILQPPPAPQAQQQRVARSDTVLNVSPGRPERERHAHAHGHGQESGLRSSLSGPAQARTQHRPSPPAPPAHVPSRAAHREVQAPGILPPLALSMGGAARTRSPGTIEHGARHGRSPKHQRDPYADEEEEEDAEADAEAETEEVDEINDDGEPGPAAEMDSELLDAVDAAEGRRRSVESHASGSRSGSGRED
ncbi:hypothetical protein MIND_00648500 [Mycena indigotica]|uniref:Uncharacterized protein n=1 Tax=Mycena indigotica TaxID=2126181 RepID=A0A8H6SUH9_9AGAR|nr:uncharacterized protein MIND_00648500 [Mycena indigotica]KAF7304165.1 hypothetical protein MIND_00648500 [Mycena indigotica]